MHNVANKTFAIFSYFIQKFPHMLQNSKSFIYVMYSIWNKKVNICFYISFTIIGSCGIEILYFKDFFFQNKASNIFTVFSYIAYKFYYMLLCLTIRFYASSLLKRSVNRIVFFFFFIEHIFVLCRKKKDIVFTVCKERFCDESSNLHGNRICPFGNKHIAYEMRIAKANTDS